MPRCRVHCGAVIPLVDVKAQYEPLIPELKERFAEVLESGRFIFGPEVEAFERESAAYLGVPHAIGVANGEKLFRGYVIDIKEVLVNGIEGGAKRVIVDLSGVTFIDSTALGVLVSGAKRVRPRNGNLDIVCTDENIIRIFEITGLDRIFGIFPSRGEALKAASS